MCAISEPLSFSMLAFTLQQQSERIFHEIRQYDDECNSTSCNSMPSGCNNNSLRITTNRGPFLESLGNFSGLKSHFKNQEALHVQSFLFQRLQLCNVSNLRIFLFFSYGILKLAFRARQLSEAFDRGVPGVSEMVGRVDILNLLINTFY